MSSARADAKAHIDEGRFVEAAAVLHALWHSEQREVGDAISYTKVLRKLHRSDEALRIAREGARMLIEGRGLGNWDTARVKQGIYGLASWCLYDLKIREQRTPSLLLAGARQIGRTLDAIGADLHEPRSPYIRSVLVASAVLNQCGRFDDAHELLASLTPARLDNQPVVLPNGRTSPSTRERWYLAMCKSLEGRDHHRDVQHLCDAALSAQHPPDQMSERSAYFLEYRRAIAIASQGDLQAAAQSLRILAAKRREWWIMIALAKVLWDAGEPTAALRDGLIGLLGSDLSKMTGSGVLLLGEWSHAQGRTELPQAAAAFVETLRHREQWPIRHDLLRRLEALRPAQIESVSDLPGASRRLRAAMWRELDMIDPPREGRVARIIGEGRAMFITSSGSTDVYARVDRRDCPPLGAVVTFRTAMSYDRKKSQLSTEAIHVRFQRSGRPGHP